MEILHGIFSKEAIEIYKTTHPAEYLALMKHFCDAKERFTGKPPKAKVNPKEEEIKAMLPKMFELTPLQAAEKAHGKVLKVRKKGNGKSSARSYFGVRLPETFLRVIGELTNNFDREVSEGADEDSDTDTDTEGEEERAAKVSNVACKQFMFKGKYAGLVKLEIASEITLKLHRCLWRYMFDSVIDKMFDHVDMLLRTPEMRPIRCGEEKEEQKGEEGLEPIPGAAGQNEKGCEYICTVGGFSDSPYLQYRLRYEFGPDSKRGLKIVTKPNPILRVVDGATKLGLHPDFLYSLPHVVP